MANSVLSFSDCFAAAMVTSDILANKNTSSRNHTDDSTFFAVGPHFSVFLGGSMSASSDS